MSTEFEILRDQDGLLECEHCPRRFLTKIVLKNHSSNEHKKGTETKANESQESQTKKDESSFQKNVHSEEQCSAGIKKKLFQKKLTSYQCQECLKYLSRRSILKAHIDTVHQKLTPYQCQECKKWFGLRQSLQNHINFVHKKFSK